MTKALTKDNYNPDKYYRHWSGRIVKIVGWFDLSDCPYVVFLGREGMKPRTWDPKLREASQKEIEAERKNQLNQHDLGGETFVGVNKAGGVAVSQGEDSIRLDKKQFERLVDIFKKGRVKG